MTTPSTAETDQLDAFLRDITEANGVEVIGRGNMDEDWLEQHSAAELWDHLLTTAVAIGKDGALSTIVATELPTGVGYVLATVRRAPEGDEQ